MSKSSPSNIVARAVLLLFFVVAGISIARLLFDGSTKQPEAGQLATARDMTAGDRVSNGMVLLKKGAEPFQMPGPPPKEYVPVYDDEPDETIKTGIISSINIVPAGSDGAVVAPAQGGPIANLIKDSRLESESSEETEGSDSDEPLFEAEDLERLADSGADVEAASGYIGGVRVSSGSGGASSSTSEPSPEPSPSPTPQLWYEGQVRGYAALYLMHPSARPAVERQMQILMDSRVRRVFLGVLVDGTFGVDYPYLNSILQRLTEFGQQVTLGLYLSNGPAMRSPNERELYAGTVNEFEPEEFRERIRSDANLRDKFNSIATAARPTFEFNRRLSRNNENIAFVMLEDNLDVNAYLEMRHIAGEVLGDLVYFVRNPCPGCYEGNDYDPAGDGLEFHEPQLIHALRATDGYSMDGKGLFFPGELDPTGLSVGDVRTLLTATVSQGVHYFALWRAQRQGIYGERVAPDQRNYEVPTLEQAEIEIDLLRFGLREVSDDSEVVSAEPTVLPR